LVPFLSCQRAPYTIDTAIDRGFCNPKDSQESIVMSQKSSVKAARLRPDYTPGFLLPEAPSAI
jgi:hypothetical protein